jgi:hypothetical protein
MEDAMEGFLLNSQDQLTIDVVTKVASAKLERKDACLILNVSQRTLERYLREFRINGIYFVKHGNYKKTPVNKTNSHLKEKVLQLVREQYFDFNMTHCLEKLKEHGFHVKREVFRKWCHEIKFVKKQKRRRGAPHYRRDRAQSEGVLVQFDGSTHRWFAERETCLITGIDDATGEVPYGEFFGSENLFACMKVLKCIIEKKGLFKLLYVDKAGVYGGIKRSGFSQIQRALGELGINVIFANSPEAKGRIERLFGTLQDRLIPEMRINKINLVSQANEFLNKVFLPHHYNPRFSVQPLNPISCYTPIHPSVNLSEIFCVKDYRVVARDHTLSWNGQRYMIAEELKYSIHKQRIEIRSYESGSWQAFFAGSPIQLVGVQELPMRSAMYR